MADGPTQTETQMDSGVHGSDIPDTSFHADVVKIIEEGRNIARMWTNSRQQGLKAQDAFKTWRSNAQQLYMLGSTDPNNKDLLKDMSQAANELYTLLYSEKESDFVCALS